MNLDCLVSLTVVNEMVKLFGLDQYEGSKHDHDDNQHK